MKILLSIYLIFIVLDYICLRYFAKNNLYDNFKELLLCITLSIIPIVNIFVLLYFLNIIIENKKMDINKIAKKILFIKDE